MLPAMLPSRRLELGLATLAVAALALAVGLTRNGPTAAGLAVIVLELIMPLLLALPAAGLLAGDPALDLLLSVPRPAPRTLAGRLALLLAWGAALGFGLQALAGAWRVALPQPGPGQPLIWAAPLLLYSGLATTGALVRGRMLDGAALALGAGMLALLSQPFIAAACAGVAGSACLGAAVSPALTMLRPTDPYWPANRLLWLMVGALLLGGGLALAGREERLLLAAKEE